MADSGAAVSRCRWACAVSCPVAASHGAAHSQRRNAGQGGLQPGPRAVLRAPFFDVSHVERFGALDGEHVAGVVQVFVAAPAKLLHHHVLRRREPGGAAQHGHENLPSPREFGVDERVIEDLKQLDFEWWVVTASPDMATAPGEGVEDDLRIKFHICPEFGDHAIDASADIHGHQHIHIPGGSRHAISTGGHRAYGHELRARGFRSFDHFDGEFLQLHAAAGLLVAVYTTWDAHAIRATPDPFTFLAWFFLITAVDFPVLMARTWARAGYRIDAGLMLRGAIGAVVAFVSFGGVMLATRIGAVGQAAVLRETSPLFAALIGWLLLGERTWGVKLALMGLIAAGAVIVQIAG